MRKTLPGKGGRWVYGFVAVAVAAVVVSIVPGVVARKARITGDTPAERIACICRVADEDRWGAGDAIAAAAAADPSPAVRRAALLALAKFPDPEHRKMVIAATAAEEAPAIRAAAVTTLGTYGDADAADHLGRLAGKDPVEEVRINAVDGLSRCADDRAIVHLVEVMEKSGNARVQQHARSAVFRRLNMPARATRPQDLAMWRNDVELVKVQPAVIAAYQKASIPLVHHPEYIIPEPGE